MASSCLMTLKYASIVTATWKRTPRPLPDQSPVPELRQKERAHSKGDPNLPKNVESVNIV